MEIKLRQINEQDDSFLKEMMYEAIFVPEGEKPYPLSVIEIPEIARYYLEWGREGDSGLISVTGHLDVGIIWSRFYNEHNKGFGFINSEIPEISMAVKPDYRGKGIGTKLLRSFFDLATKNGYKALSLSVDKRNPAVRLYKRTGFEIVSEPGTDYIMRKKLNV